MQLYQLYHDKADSLATWVDNKRKMAKGGWFPSQGPVQQDVLRRGDLPFDAAQHVAEYG